MRVLYVVGSCLTNNTSANMSHNAYVQGLLENHCAVDILMAKDSWGNADSGLPIWEQAHYYCYRTAALRDKVRIWARKFMPAEEIAVDTNKQEPLNQVTDSSRAGKQATVRSWIKKAFYWIFPNDPCYPLEKTWIKKAAKFRNKQAYDLIISNSSPAASHKLVWLLLQSKNIQCKRWVQIWEDPWYSDLYGNKSQVIYQEEHRLLQVATEVYYVSPLTLDYQKKLFPDCAAKMKHIPLPYLNYTDDTTAEDVCSFGYFGDYYSHTRNLEPFYQALKESGCRGYIYGDSDLKLESTEQITVRGRVTLDVLAKVQAETGVLIHLCNLRGGQIPGKIYHYSATNKPILFILDGTEEEIKKILAYFGQFRRYYFVINQEHEIYNAIITILKNPKNYKGEKVEAFSPQNVVAMLL